MHRPTTKAPHRRPMPWLLALACQCALLASSSAASSSAPPAPAQADHAWRCTTAQGTLVYSQTPCQGQARLLPVGDQRDAAQRRQARRNLHRAHRLARRMVKDRMRQERLARRQGPRSLSPLHKPKPAKATKAAKAHDADHRPVPFSQPTRPVRLKVNKAAPAAADTGSALRP